MWHNIARPWGFSRQLFWRVIPPGMVKSRSFKFLGDKSYSFKLSWAKIMIFMIIVNYSRLLLRFSPCYTSRSLLKVIRNWIWTGTGFGLSWTKLGSGNNNCIMKTDVQNIDEANILLGLLPLFKNVNSKNTI